MRKLTGIVGKTTITTIEIDDVNEEERERCAKQRMDVAPARTIEIDGLIHNPLAHYPRFSAGKGES